MLPSISGENVLQFQFETRTPGFLTGTPFAWSPDGRRLISGMLTRPDSAGRQDASLWVFEVNGEKAVGRRILDGHGTADAGIAWSPDGELLAVVKRSGEIRVYSSRDFREIARRDVADDDAELDHFGRVQVGTGVAFSKDGSSLWIARLEENVRARFRAAVRLDARTLDLVDSYEIDPPIPGNRTVTARTTIEPTPNGPRLVTLISSFTGIKAPNGGDTAHRFAYGVDLDNKRELFPHFQLIEHNTLYQDPGGILLSPDAAMLAAFLSTTTDPRQDPSDYRDVDIYSTQTGQRIALFDTAQALSDEHPSIKFFGRSGAVLIATSHHLPEQTPGLIAFDSQTGKVVERVTGRSLDPRLEFSWDRRRMVGSLSPFGDGMQFFSVNR